MSSFPGEVYVQKDHCSHLGNPVNELVCLIDLVAHWLCFQKDSQPITLGMENVETTSMSSPKGEQMSQTNSMEEVKSWPAAKSGSAQNKPMSRVPGAHPMEPCPDPHTSIPAMGSLEEAEGC